MRRKPGTRLLLTVDEKLLAEAHRYCSVQGIQIDEFAKEAFRLYLWAQERAQLAGAPRDALKASAQQSRPHQGLVSGAGLRCDSATCWCHAWTPENGNPTP